MTTTNYYDADWWLDAGYGLQFRVDREEPTDSYVLSIASSTYPGEPEVIRVTSFTTLDEAQLVAIRMYTAITDFARSYANSYYRSKVDI